MPLYRSQQTYPPTSEQHWLFSIYNTAYSFLFLPWPVYLLPWLACSYSITVRGIICI